MYRPVLVTAPAIKPVTLAEAKRNSRVDHDDDDDLINALIDAATSHYDGWTGILTRCLVEQTWRQDFDGFQRCFVLPLFPVISITSLKYQDEDNVEQTVSSSNYQLLNADLGAYVRLKDEFSYPAVYHQGPVVSITYKAGYANTAGPPETSNVPAALKHAIMMVVSHWYEHREDVVAGVTPSKMPLACDALTAPFRRNRF